MTAYLAYRADGNVHVVAYLVAKFTYGFCYFLGSAVALVAGGSSIVVVVGGLQARKSHEYYSSFVHVSSAVYEG